MALRNHALDDKITSAALGEFKEKGYSGASLRKIAEKAGVTVGAIQTRYASKDALFAALLQPFLTDIAATFQSVKADYYADADGDFRALLESSMQRESEAILRLIFAHYDEAFLLFYRSAGSSLETYFDQVVQSKIDESVRFFRGAGQTGVDEKLLGMLIAAQFDSYRRIGIDCPDRQTAEAYMQALMTYHFGGWAALFHSIDSSKEDAP